MLRIAIQVENAQKAELLVELLSAIDFVQGVNVEIENGRSQENDKIVQYPQPSVDPARPAMLREQAAFDAMKAKLLAKYPNEYVALFQGQVIDHDVDQLVLIERRNKLLPNEVVLIQHVSEEPEPQLHFRSPRFVKELGA